MQENLAILLEWFAANGIAELFNNTVEPTRENGGGLGGIIRAFAEQQNEVKEFSIISGVEPREVADRINNVGGLVENVLALELYSNFRKMANNTVIMDGNVDAKILIINDLPNDEDDANGRIFSGESGILLENMMRAIDIERRDFCLLNMFFWRLPGNRNPIREELDSCEPFVEKIISLIKPKLIILTGNYSTSALFEKNKTVLNIRGKFFEYTNCYLQEKIRITGLYSPVFLIKNKEKKREAWADLQEIKKVLDSLSK
jgi:DNA polymerase